MKKKIYKAIFAFFILILLVSISLAITPKEKQGLNEFLNGVDDDKTKFEIFLAFADDQGYDFSGEDEINNRIETNENKFRVLLYPYDNIKGINKNEIDANTIKTMEESGIKVDLPGIREKIRLGELGGFWKVFIILATLAILISALEFYRRKKIIKNRKKR